MNLPPRICNDLGAPFFQHRRLRTQEPVPHSQLKVWQRWLRWLKILRGSRHFFPSFQQVSAKSVTDFVTNKLWRPTAASWKAFQQIFLWANLRRKRLENLQHPLSSKISSSTDPSPAMPRHGVHCAIISSGEEDNQLSLLRKSWETTIFFWCI